MPAAAKHSATPRPIVPAPMMAAVRGHSCRWVCDVHQA